MIRRAVAVLFVSFFALAGFAQSPSDSWRTLATKHFRIYYPAAYAAWAERAASRMESIRSAIVAETGYAPEIVTDFVVINPLAVANGATLPLLDRPRIILFAEPPGPDSVIGDYSNWIDLLVVHEMTHMVHLVRPSRSPLERAFEQIFPIGPLAIRAPRWVSEGYATVVEGRLTGSGRPSSTIRAAILRKWAQSGRLPAYAQLQSDQRFLGMSMAYLVGSAYLEWLEQRNGAGSLRKLWPRMSARSRRSFDQAFEGVFGDSPERLYGQFTAELTERAVNVDRETRGERREGALWQETQYDSGDPDVSPDGKSLAVVLRAREKPQHLVIWSTAAPVEEEKKYEERIRKTLTRDPQDVAPVRTKPLPREPEHDLVLRDGGDIDGPRWMPDGRSILFVHRVPDHDGNLHHDLFRWTPSTDDVERLTHLADVTDADPFPSGTEAVAVRTRDGFSQLVTVDLATGSVRPLTEPSLDRVYSHPRVSRDGRRIAFVAHTTGTWHLVVRDLASGSEHVFDMPPRTNVAMPEWSRTSGDLFATVMSGGFIDIDRFTPDGTAVPVTRTSGGAFSPAPSSDGRLFFMSLEPDGYTVHVLNQETPAPPREASTRSLVPALPPAPSTPPLFAERPVEGPWRYGIGRQEPTWVLNGNNAPSAHTIEIGARIGDLIGRLDTLLIVDLPRGHSPQRGSAFATAWRGWPVAVGLHVFDLHEPQSRQHGVELRGQWDATYPLDRISVEGGVLDSRRDAQGRNLGFATATLQHHVRFGDNKLEGSLHVAGEGGDAPHGRVAARGGFTFGSLTLGARLQADRAGTREAMSVGGIATSVVPGSAFANRVLDPALPFYALSGRRYTGGSVDASFSGLTFFYREHKLASKLRLAGIQVERFVPPQPLVRTPAMALTLGVARILDAPLRNRTRWWIGIRLEP